MLEPLTNRDIAIRQATSIRNVVDFNFRADNIGFLSAWLAKRARSIKLRELGLSTLIVSMVLPVRTPVRALMPSTIAYMQRPEDTSIPPLEAVFGNSVRARMIVLHEVLSRNLLTHVMSSYAPDIVCTSGDTAWCEEWLAQHLPSHRAHVITDAELISWGLPLLKFWVNDSGAAPLDASLVMFDNAHQIRKREISRVYDVTELVLCTGFYAVETDAGHHWAWTGPQTVSTLLMPSHGSGKFRITLFFFGTKIPIDADHFDVLVDGRRCQCAFFAGEKIELITDSLRDGCSHRVDIVQRRMVATADGSRHLGCALHKLKIDVPS